MSEVTSRGFRWPDQKFLERSYGAIVMSLNMVGVTPLILWWWSVIDHEQKGILDIPGMNVGMPCFAVVLGLAGLAWFVYSLKFPRTMAISAMSISKIVGGKVKKEIAFTNIARVEVGRSAARDAGSGIYNTKNDEPSSYPAVWYRIHSNDGAVIQLGFEANSRKLIQAMLAERLPSHFVPPEWEAAREQLR